MDRRPWIELLRIAWKWRFPPWPSLGRCQCGLGFGVMMAGARFDAPINFPLGCAWWRLCRPSDVEGRHAARLDCWTSDPSSGWHTEFVWGILGLSVAAMLFMRQRHFQPTERAMLLPDAIGLGLFAAVGVDIATAVGMPALIAVMMGVTTGVFGGVLRDVLCNEVPQAFSDHRPYALCAFAAAAGPMWRCGRWKAPWSAPAGVRADHGRAVGFGAVAQLGAARLAGMNGARP